RPIDIKRKGEYTLAPLGVLDVAVPPELALHTPGLGALSKQDLSQYKNFGVLETTATTNIYKEPSTGAAAAYQVPAGTKLLFDDVKLDAAGAPTWYHVANSPGAGSQYSRNYGWITAGHITCAQRHPGKIGT
ncbi:MAG: hypothetical protein ACJ73D_09675, partial [Pyrinomonadaceae bacterium]